ncbi:MAG: sulfatase-like hydrolase/transferase [Candidatus Cryptobacteroides sp.]
MKHYFQDKASLPVFCAVLSAFTLIAYNIPAFRFAANDLNGDLEAVVIIASLVVIMLALNYFVYYLILRLGRIVGKCVLAFSFIANSISLYFINTFDASIDDSMMGNVFNTQWSEASGFISLGWALYILLLGILPSVYVIARKVDYGSFKRMGAHIGGALALTLAVIAANIPNWTFINRNQGPLGSLVLPWSYTVNSFRYHSKVRKSNRPEIPLPDATFTTASKDVCVLVIGESARRDHFSLYGYPRETNPLLKEDKVITLEAKSAGTYTILGVKAILSHIPTDEPYEILPNYMSRSGADVFWRTSNWGEPPVHIGNYLKVNDLKQKYPEADDRYDGIPLEGLAGQVLASDRDKILVVLHTSTSHGPGYDTLYPEEFRQFTPVCTTTELSKADPGELVNAYDNTILYTDFLLHSLIGELQSLPQDWRKCMLYVSDHGESLGENGIFMHGVTMSMAPKEQYEIPFIVWLSEGSAKVKEIKEAGQYNVFHSVMNFLGAESEIYDEKMNIFE